MGKSGWGHTDYSERVETLRRAIKTGTLTMAPAYGEAPVTEYPDFTQVVNAGAAWLDRVLPGWDEQLDLDTLDLDDQNQCILGQSWPHYAMARNIWCTAEDNFSRFLATAISPDNDEARRFAYTHGFALSEEVYAWNHVESTRRVSEGEMSAHFKRQWPQMHWLARMTVEVDAELWEQLTRTWIVLIEARKQVRESRLLLLEDVRASARQEVMHSLHHFV